VRAYARYTSNCEPQYTGKSQSIRELINNAARKAQGQIQQGAGQAGQVPGQAAQAAQGGKFGPQGQISQAALLGVQPGQAAGAIGSRGISALHGSALEGFQQLYGLDPSPIDPVKTLRGSKTSKFMFAPQDTKLPDDGNPQQLYRIKTVLGKRERQRSDNRRSTINQRKRLAVEGV
jgi:hypothetical protein